MDQLVGTQTLRKKTIDLKQMTKNLIVWLLQVECHVEILIITNVST